MPKCGDIEMLSLTASAVDALSNALHQSVVNTAYSTVSGASVCFASLRGNDLRLSTQVGLLAKAREKKQIV
ncbi:hypothetical protein OAO01_08585 [Oligoflexia bacterium]|nr:hypothetical protein [Oligoflexia bacterium]